MWSWGIRQIGIDFSGSASDASVYGWITDGKFSDDVEGIGGACRFKVEKKTHL